MKPVILVLFLIALLPSAQERQTFTGVITDEMCPMGDHSRMRMGPSDAECTKACVSAHGAGYVLYNGKRAYLLSDQEAPEKFAGQKVRIIGTLDLKTMTIRVESISGAR
jgi:hypothetical protein